MKWHSLYAVVAVTLIFALSGVAQQQQPSALRLTVEKSVEIGLENSAGLHSSLMRVNAAQARAGEASTSLLPAVRFNGSYTRLSDVPAFEATIPANAFGPGFPPQNVSFPLSQTILNNYNLRLTVQQPLFTGFRLSSNADVARHSANATEQEYARDRADLAYDIQTAYWNLYRAKEFHMLVIENVAQVKSHLDDIRKFLQQGMVTTNDVLKVEVQHSNAQLMEIDAKNNVRLATLGLNNIMGIDLATEIELGSVPEVRAASSDTSLASIQTAGDVNELVRQALERRPEVKAMESRINAGHSGVRLARSGWFPQIYLAGNYNYARPNQRIVPARDRFDDTWDVSLVASFDIWNWGATLRQTEQAQAQLSQAEDGLRQVRDGIALEVTQSYLNRNQAKERIVVARQTVQQAEESYRTTNERFKQGLALNTDLLDAEVALLQAKTNLTQSLIDFELAEARLRKSVSTNEQY